MSIKRRKEWRRNRYWTRSRSFGARLGLPKVDVDKLIDLQLKNIDAIAQSAHVAGEGAKTLAAKQRDIIDAAFKQTSDMVREFHPDWRSPGNSRQAEGLREESLRAHCAEYPRRRRFDQEDDIRRDDDCPGQVAIEPRRAA